MSESNQWQAAIAASELSEDKFHPAAVGEHKLIVLRIDGEVCAYRDACPHESYPLSKHGERQDFVLVCNKHLWEFDAASGEHISRLQRPECNLKRYPTREVNGMIEVDISAVPAA